MKPWKNTWLESDWRNDPTCAKEPGIQTGTRFYIHMDGIEQGNLIRIPRFVPDEIALGLVGGSDCVQRWIPMCRIFETKLQAQVYLDQWRVEV